MPLIPFSASRADFFRPCPTPLDGHLTTICRRFLSGGTVWESNPPGALRRRTGFEDQRRHQPPAGPGIVSNHTSSPIPRRERDAPHSRLSPFSHSLPLYRSTSRRTTFPSRSSS